MPLMKPRKGQSTRRFLSNFMHSSQAKRDFPDPKQRVAVGYSQARSAGRKVPKK